MSGLLTLQLSAREPSQLRVNKRHQPVACLVITPHATREAA
jgi:hypothetical protein